MHPQDCMKLKVRRHQLDSMKKKINDVASDVEANPRTGNIESDHRGRPSQSKKERREKAIEPSQQGPGKEEKRGSVAGAGRIARSAFIL